ncbi:hypothetical protein BVG16_29755 [Paenibacillus selenitireducens]|uniref:Uncharacterized protein n=1 Tax=Paenibacillus selenitireducens TaxID=1324314 RepID=A0A1T2X0N7_9BACL|nr:hypothetical protein [Paenibacillus selenitireducens]OPA73266.1 hypothetical protein BVG16_29755 [Paenibacillus selenitireducens]
MRETIIATITKTNNRTSLYHFTRASNLQAIVHFDALFASNKIHPWSIGERRAEPIQVNYQDYAITINSHIKIPDVMIDPANTQEQFRACLDQHVFFWPTLKDCRKMMDTYARREPEERFVVLEIDAYSLLFDYYPVVKITKYDSGSSPRFPARCSYKKSRDIFLPLQHFKSIVNNTVPTKASEVREVLIEEQVHNLSKYILAIYIEDIEDIPACWRGLGKPIADLQDV